MGWLEQIQDTGIYRNDETRCWEAWVVIPEEGIKQIVSSCSVEASDSTHEWWLQEVCGALLRQWGEAVPVAA